MGSLQKGRYPFYGKWGDIYHGGDATVIDSDYRWEFGEFATVSVLKEGGLEKGNIIFMRNRLLHHHTCRSRLKQIAKQILLLSNRRDER